MATQKEAFQIQEGEFVAVDFGPGIGCQWAKVLDACFEVTEEKPVELTLQLSTRFGYRRVAKLFSFDKIVSTQSHTEFYAWLNLYGLEF